MSIVAFDSVGFLTRYPEFSGVSVPLLALYFGEAGLYCRNDGSGPVQDITVRTPLLWMLTSHIAELNTATSARGSSPLVGRISEATEGSVHVSTDLGPVSGSAAWFQQTKYGAAFWQASVRYRRAQFVQAPSPSPYPFFTRS